MTALEDMDLIEPLLQRLRQRMSAASSPPEPAMPELPVVDGQNLGRLLGQEVVRLMLENLTHDQRLLPAIRRQIGLLEPALVRLSLAEPRFFSERQHPARQLLEAITQRSLGYQSHVDEGFAPLLQSVRAAVRSINRVQVSEQVFARLLHRLRKRWEQDDARKLQRRADAARALLHAEQRQILAERLAADYLQRLQGKDVPEFVQRFLAGPWAQAVAETQLEPAPSGGAAEPLDGVADELIWSVQPALIRRDVDRLGQLVPRLVTQLRQGLERIGYPAELTGPFLDALVALHEKAFDIPTLTRVPFIELTEVVEPVLIPTALQDADGPPAAPETVPEAAPETFWIAGQAAQDAGFVDAVSGPMPLEPLAPTDLGTGAWVDLKVQGEWVRAQLTWTSPRGRLYMFIFPGAGPFHDPAHTGAPAGQRCAAHRFPGWRGRERARRRRPAGAAQHPVRWLSRNTSLWHLARGPAIIGPLVSAFPTRGTHRRPALRAGRSPISLLSCHGSMRFL
jgi:hypothetical protein